MRRVMASPPIGRRLEGPMRVALICGIYVRHDAISSIVEEHAQLLQSLPEVDSVTIFSQGLTKEASCETILVGTSGELLSHPAFAAADVAIFHWGIHYDLFNALIVLAATGPQPVCVFHNCTPIELCPQDQLDTARRSFEQLELLPAFDIPTWTYSPFNRRTLLDIGVKEQLIGFVPFPIRAPRPLVDRRSSDHVEAIVVGRFVPSKGIHVVIEALGLLDEARRKRLHIRVIGNVSLSDTGYLKGIRRRISELALDDTIEIAGTVDDATLWDLYESSHILISTSLHEGLCIPIVEAYLAGCRAIGTSAGNLPFVVSPTDPVVEAADPAALAAALTQVIDDIESGVGHDTVGARAVIATYSEASSREALRRELLAIAASARSPLLSAGEPSSAA